MPEPSPPEKQSDGVGFGAVFAVLAMVGCCGGPLLIALASSVAIGTLLGVGGGIVAAVALGALAASRIRARRRACAPRPPEHHPALGPRR